MGENIWNDLNNAFIDLNKIYILYLIKLDRLWLIKTPEARGFCDPALVSTCS